MAVKLVIWDLDETFWKGTLSEGKVAPVPGNLELVRALAGRGIMNSVVSKNDREEAMGVLTLWQIAEYFVFPRIAWAPKGMAVRELLQDMGLRAENVLFIDDNPSNLEEVKFYNKGITCVPPSYVMEQDILSMDAFQGKDDIGLSRLRHYRVLEERIGMKQAYASNEEFLRASDIRLTICHDCLKYLDRLEELVQRTNQLNYTKNRMGKQELEALMKDSESECAYIMVRDAFGDYGIVGFYAKKDNQLIHFLFSCRVLNFGIENYLYRKLGRPKLEISGEVATPLSDKDVDWVMEVDGWEEENTADAGMPPNRKLLMVGGCDLEQASRYLESKYGIDKEFATIIEGQPIRRSDTCQLVNAASLDKETKEELCERLPFYAHGVSFGTKIFSGKYEVILLSVVDDYIRGMYRHKEKGFLIGYGSYWGQEEELLELSEKQRRYLQDNFIFIGKEDTATFKDNLRKILGLVGSKAKVILVNGAEIDVSEWIGQERCARNQEMNAAVDEIVKEFANACLLDMRKLIVSKGMLTRRDNRHFNRQAYYRMAQEMIQIMESFGSTKGCVRKKGIAQAGMEDCFRRIIRKVKKLCILYGNCHTGGGHRHTE